MRKLNLKKKVITVLTDQEKQFVNGGIAATGTTSYSDCSGFLCCSQKSCKPASEGDGATCLNAGCQ